MIVVTGQMVTPEKTEALGKADFVRRKPVKQSDLASDIVSVLKYEYDDYWRSFNTLKLISSRSNDLFESANFIQKRKMNTLLKNIGTQLSEHKPGVVENTTKLLTLVRTIGEIGVVIYNIVK